MGYVCVDLVRASEDGREVDADAVGHDALMDVFRERASGGWDCDLEARCLTVWPVSHINDCFPCDVLPVCPPDSCAALPRVLLLLRDRSWGVSPLEPEPERACCCTSSVGSPSSVKPCVLSARVLWVRVYSLSTFLAAMSTASVGAMALVARMCARKMLKALARE